MQARKRASGGRPTRDAAALKTPRILDAARAAFATKGVAGTSLDELARELRVSKHTIYRRFPNKLALLEAVVARDIEGFRAELSDAAAMENDALEALRRMALRYVEIGVSHEHADLYLVAQAESLQSPQLRERLATWSRLALAPLVQATSKALAAGALKSDAADCVHEVLVDLLEGVNNRHRLGRPPSAEAGVAETFASRWRAFTKAFAPCPGGDGPPQRG